jgi:lipopolysaccharide transport system permease protein
LSETLISDSGSGQLPVHRITPVKRRVRLLDLLRYAAVIRVVAVRDFKAKYKQSVLGVAWVVIQPAGLLIGLVIAFSHRLGSPGSSQIPYALFAMSGLCVWSYFQAAMVMACASLVSNQMLVKRTPCPRIAFPVSGLLATLPSLAVVLVSTLVTALATGVLSLRVLLLPIAVVWLLILTGGIVGAGSSFAVYFRDVINALPLVLQIGIFIAPIGYALSSLSGTAHLLVELNPLTGLIELWRWMLLSGYHFTVTPIVICGAETLALAAFGWWVFGRLETTMADRI